MYMPEKAGLRLYEDFNTYASRRLYLTIQRQRFNSTVFGFKIQRLVHLIGLLHL